ncbi:hypothetical protein ACFV0D_12585 [Streptomyces sp. NPDC059556]
MTSAERWRLAALLLLAAAGVRAHRTARRRYFAAGFVTGLTTRSRNA